MLHIHQKPLFATRIYCKQLPHLRLSSFIKDLKEEAYQIKKADHFGQTWSLKNYRHGYTSYGSNASGFDRLHLMSSTFQELEKALNKQVNAYVKTLGLDISSGDLKMTHCWLNIMGSEASHASHAHPLSVISGTFYVSVPKGSSSLKFEDPRQGLFMNSPAIKQPAKLAHQRYVEIQPLNGYLVLFESWLKHEVPPQKGPAERISISFNYGWS